MVLPGTITLQMSTRQVHMTCFRPWCACTGKHVLVCRHRNMMGRSTRSGSGSLPLHEELSNIVGGSCCSVPDMKPQLLHEQKENAWMRIPACSCPAQMLLTVGVLDDSGGLGWQPAPATMPPHIGHSYKLGLCASFCYICGFWSIS